MLFSFYVHRHVHLHGRPHDQRHGQHLQEMQKKTIEKEIYLNIGHTSQDLISVQNSERLQVTENNYFYIIITSYLVKVLLDLQAHLRQIRLLAVCLVLV